MRCEIESGWKLEVVRVALALFSLKTPPFTSVFEVTFFLPTFK